MIIVDTNVISEVLKPQPAIQVENWVASYPPLMLYTTSVCLAELWYGLERLPYGKRRSHLEASLESMMAQVFAGPTLLFDEDAARAYAKIVAHRDAIGRPIADFDAMIAAIAQSHNAAVATRDIDGFTDCGVDLINPWQS